MKRLVVFLFLFRFLTGIPIIVLGQYYKTGEDPARLKWNSIQLDHFQIIYPRGVDSLAFRYAWLLEQAAPPVLSSLRSKNPSIPVLIRPYDVNSNGTVVWAPKRMELKTTPPSEHATQNWEKQLVLHETRHVAQMQRVGENFFRVLGWFIGQQSEGIAVGLYFPKWILEGDAVITETFFSNAGRGREASFLMPYKAYFAQDKSFSYNKWRHGSFRDYIPDHYALGYMKLSVARLFSGEEALNRIFTDITKYPYWPLMHGKTFRRNYGYRAAKLWEPAVEFYKNLWNEQDARKAPFHEGVQINKPVKDYVKYGSPAFVLHGDGSHVLYAVKSSLAQTKRLVRFPDEDQVKEQTVCLLGQINSSLHSAGPDLYWSETVSGYRWAHENFSVIMNYNTITGKKKMLLPATRYFNPSPNHSGRLLAVVHYPPQGGSELHLLDPETGKMLEKYTAPAGEQMTDIAWSCDNYLFLLMTGEKGCGIYRLDRSSGNWETVLPPAFHSLTGLHEQKENGLLYFTSDRLCNTDNIFSLDPESGQILQLTDVRFGAFDPVPSEKDDCFLYYVNYTAQGYQLAKLHLDSLANKPVDLLSPRKDPFILASTSEFNIDTLNVPSNLSYPVKKYNKFLNAFRFHSWLPFYFNFDNIANFTFQQYYQTVALGAVIMSQNTLGTLTSTLGYSYHKGFHAGHLKMDFSGWLPVFSLQLDINDRSRTNTFVTPDNDNGKYKWIADTVDLPHVEASLLTYIPFMFNRHGWRRGLVPSLRYRFSNDTYRLPGKGDLVYSQTLQAGIQYYQMVNRSPRDIFPRLGFGLNIQSSFFLGTGTLFTNMLYTQAYGYLPGVFRNQALKWNVGWQRQEMKDRYLYLGTFIRSPRGMEDKIFAPETFTASLDYAVPIWVGDPSILNIIYIKRLQMIPFADFVRTKQQDGIKNKYWSVGTDLLMDFHLFKIGIMITAGVRYAYTCEKKHRVEFLFSLPTTDRP
ncbi:MAG TPA: hypothetical protein PKU85_02425 [Bacteroidales bacterium]|nr:MAG: hypothetical protein BWX62_00163 [Bacteroidetes bacterium ADurb.Bin037]HPV88054.1 hypothetical protein [Bacteroidales bacterium]